MTAIAVIPLNRVVISSPDRIRGAVLRKELEATLTGGKKILACAGRRAAVLGDKICIAECSPVLQGVMTSSTKVLFAPDLGLSATAPSSNTLDGCDSGRSPGGPDSVSPSPLLLSDFAHDAVPSLGSACADVARPCVLFDSCKTATVPGSTPMGAPAMQHLPLSVAPSVVDKSCSSQFVRPEPEGLVDRDAMVWLPISVMLEAQLKEGAWALIEPQPCPATPAPVPRGRWRNRGLVAQAFVADNGEGPALTQQLASQLGLGRVHRSRVSRLPHSPPVAESLVLASVATPAGRTRAGAEPPKATSAVAAQGLKHFFSTPRVLSEGDLVSIDAPPDAPTRWHRLYQVKSFKAAAAGGTTGGSTSTAIVGPSSAIYQASKVSTALPPTAPIAAAQNEPPVAAAELGELLAAAAASEAAGLGLRHSALFHGPRGVGKCASVYAAASEHGFHVFEASCHEIRGESPGKTETRLRELFAEAASCSPCILFFRHIHALLPRAPPERTLAASILGSTLSELIGGIPQAGSTRTASPGPLVVVGTTHEALSGIPSDLLSCMIHIIELEPPDEATRVGLFVDALRGKPCAADVSPAALAKVTASFTARDVKLLVSQAVRTSVMRCDDANGEFDPGTLTRLGVCLLAEDFDVALNTVRTAQGGVMGKPEIPNVAWSE